MMALDKFSLLALFVIVCQTSALPNRIIGGNVASEGQFPYHAGIIIDDTQFCGASLISTEYLITAAHCIYRAQSIEVHLGAERINDPNEPGHVIMIATEKIIHEYFDFVGNKFDVALIKLPTLVNETNIAPIALPSWSAQNSTFVGARGRTSGWGNIDDTIPGISTQLRFVDFTVITTSECQESYGTDIVTECNVCTDSESGQVSFCNGDAGGPLALLNESGSVDTLIGIASFGNPFACESSTPLVFVRISCYLEWIENRTGIVISP